MRDAITQERLKSVLSYNPDTGVFIWQNPPNNHAGLKGKVAGTTFGGYIAIGIDGTVYRAHRLAWLFTYGKWPSEIDHKNRIRNDNRINNLRECTHAENVRNHSRLVNGSGLPTGVNRTPYGRYVAKIRFNNSERYLGTFSTAEEAKSIYLKERKNLFGEFCP